MIGNTQGVKKLTNPAPKAKANFNDHCPLYLPLKLTAITILTHDIKIYWFSIYSSLVLYFYKNSEII